jgi:hypothetical protein
MANTIQFEDKGNGVLGTTIQKKRTTVQGKPFTTTECCRIIPEGEGFRIDFAGHIAGTWLPWEPINDTVYPTVNKAKAAIRTYAEEESK